jgi:hypothetical protein
MFYSYKKTTGLSVRVPFIAVRLSELYHPQAWSEAGRIRTFITSYMRLTGRLAIMTTAPTVCVTCAAFQAQGNNLIMVDRQQYNADTSAAKPRQVYALLGGVTAGDAT